MITGAIVSVLILYIIANAKAIAPEGPAALSLNLIRIGGFKLGFWFAQQGAIYVFVTLIFVYIKLMNKLDKEFGFNEDEK